MESRQTAFPVGRFKGCLISDAPSDYLRWVIEKGDPFGDDIKDVAREEYKFRTDQKAHWGGSSCVACKKK